jgi:S-adenosylmethionine hydrolase
LKNNTPPIVMLTDFGQVDPFVGIMKGVIHGIHPRAAVIDLSHGIRPQDVFHGAFVLFRSCAWFPRGSVFCAVVDPGVGTDRRPVAVKTRDYVFVGPDNGLVWAAADANGIETAVCLDTPDFFLDEISGTFHGRDIFAPVSAHLSLQTPLAEMGPVIHDLNRLELPEPEARKDALVLTVLDKDIYGNLTLNIPVREFFKFAGRVFSLEFEDVRINRFHTTYGEAEENIAFALAGSHGFMEIAVKNGSAAELTGASTLDRFTLVSGTDLT